jgi:hypothetical protein
VREGYSLFMPTNSSLSSAQLTFSDHMVALARQDFLALEGKLFWESEARGSCIDYEELDYAANQLDHSLHYIAQVW